jgi:hypothetical protein
MNRISLDPIEWDFRAVAEAAGEDHLDLVVAYEYARQHPTFAHKFSSWKSNRIRVQEDQRTNRDGLEIQTFLNQGFDSLTPPVKTRIMESFPDRLWGGLDFLVYFPDFPLPFLKADTGWRPPAPSFHSGPVTISLWGQEFDANPFALGTRIKMRINWSRGSPGEVISAFTSWVNRVAPSECREIEARGQDTTNIHRLKWLAALRLSEIGMQFKTIQEQLKIYVSNTRSTCANDVIPIFSRIDKWNEAVEKAEKYVAQVPSK